MTAVRDIYIQRFRTDLIGPINGKNEIINYSKEGPDKEYFVGKIFPQRTPQTNESKDEIIEGANGSSLEGSGDQEVATDDHFTRPSSFGLTFAIRFEEDSVLQINYQFGKYIGESDLGMSDNEINFNWNRYEYSNEGESIDFSPVFENAEGEIPNSILSDLNLSFSFKSKILDSSEKLLSISIFAVNNNMTGEDDTEITRNEKTIFQSFFSVSPLHTSIVPLPKISNPHPSDELNNYLYRDKNSYAIGHTCSATWEVSNLLCSKIMTEWIPEHLVHDMSSKGDHSLHDLDLSAESFINNSKEDSIKVLKEFVEEYRKWIIKESEFEFTQYKEKDNFTSIRDGLVNRASNLVDRMSLSIDFLDDDKAAFQAFQYANLAMRIQYKWLNIDLDWRPFQLGFVLLTLESTLNLKSLSRTNVDLLWFPTGGGKTEAYLFLSSILLFYRRLIKGSLNSPDGLAIFTRYTLRGLTLDQFKRLNGTILACELTRRISLKNENIAPDERNSFSLGMWVGQAATPNTLKQANDSDSQGSYKVLRECPCCGQSLFWGAENKNYRPYVNNEKMSCEISKEIKYFPISVIDELIYNNPPSVIIGTVDKFVQIIRKPANARRLFSLDDGNRGPDLVIQDELHLISGPLGSISGLFEILLEVYTSQKNNISPKIIGSTATIQRSADQILGLYGQESTQFPLNITNNDDNFFSNVDKKSEGRKYLGVSSAASPSATYLLQIIAAILMQAKNNKDINSYPSDEIDPYSTLVTYFNTLRVLGGSRVVLQDDAPAAIQSYADKHNEIPNTNIDIEELTSQSSQEELEETLSRLTLDHSQQDHIPILLASVMISVGLDISRLGLMLVDGQPKSIAEYIQATSRVGRGKIPGLVITLFNEFKPRDKSYFETFNSWHQSLYRYVEATGVTPFSARARQKILPALVVSLGLLILGRSENSLSISINEKKILEPKIIKIILDKLILIDKLELADTQTEIVNIMEKWLDRGIGIRNLWNDYEELNSLFISAEAAAAKNAINAVENIAFIAPNSVREVEPSVQVRPLGVIKKEILSQEQFPSLKNASPIRRSQTVFLYGPGAIINLRNGNAAISAIMTELAAWEFSGTARTKTTRLQRFNDARLSHSLNEKHDISVDYFRLPPVEPENKKSGFSGKNKSKAHLIAKVFPEFLLCPKCQNIKRFDKWSRDEGSIRRYCSSCSSSSTNTKFVVPVRFVRACENGHLDNFNFSWWLKHCSERYTGITKEQQDCMHADHLKLIQEKGLGLSSLKLRCKECGLSCSMKGIFQQKTKCTGRKPWLIDEKDHRDECDQMMVASQRNAKNLWLGLAESAIFIPPWDEVTPRKLGDWWDLIMKRSTPEDRRAYINFNLDDINEKSNTNFTSSELSEIVETEKNNMATADPVLKNDEYKAFTQSNKTVNHGNFQIRAVPSPPKTDNFIEKVIEVQKLKEMRALWGFQRLKGELPVKLSSDENKWLPATEMFGEGIFIALKDTIIIDFINSNEANRDFIKISADIDPINKKYIFIHSLAHVLMKGLSIESGYSLSSVKERIYSRDGMSGILIFTSSSDSEGTLGGLSRLAYPKRLSQILEMSSFTASRCSNDPLCSHGALSKDSSKNGSVCHSCMLIPETSCEDFNSNLSRVMIGKFFDKYYV